MSKAKNLKEKQLNDVSGGGFAFKSPICSAAENFGLGSQQFLNACVKAGFSFEKIAKISWSDIEQAEQKIDNINRGANLTREELNYLNSWGVKT